MSREMCHCGHTKSNHYLDSSVRPPALCSCLAMGCDCKRYADEDGPKPKGRLVRPAHVSSCRCYRCKEFLKDNGIDPDISDGGPDHVTPMWPGVP